MVFLLFFVFQLGILYFLSRLVSQELSLFLYHLTKSQTTTIQILALLFLPGVIVHELAHFLIAGILFVPTGEIEFLPQITPHGVKLGSVAIGKTDPLRRALIGFAPVFVGIGVLASGLFFITSDATTLLQLPFWQLGVVGYLVFEIGNTMFSSKKDMEGTIELIGTSLFILAIVYGLGFRIPLSFLLFLDTPVVVHILRQLTLFLLLPISIDVFIYCLTRFVGRR